MREPSMPWLRSSQAMPTVRDTTASAQPADQPVGNPPIGTESLWRETEQPLTNAVLPEMATGRRRHVSDALAADVGVLRHSHCHQIRLRWLKRRHDCFYPETLTLTAELRGLWMLSLFVGRKAERMSLRLSSHVVPLLAVLMTVVSGCASVTRMAFTEQDQKVAEVEGFSGIRFWGDGSADEFGLGGPMPKPPIRSGRITYLALSGGGSGGAFGAGVLTGWTAAGTRPTFDVVSGVSAGALIAPFAFLGSSYDHTLTELYTSGIAETLVRPRLIIGLLGSALSDPAPLRRLVERYATDDMLRQIAVEHSKGRRLFVVTTNLDAQRTVIWDMGAIAARGEKQALDLFRNVLIASASIPAVFPPVMIEVTVNGNRFQEMHSDGGATTQLFTAPEAFLASTHITPKIKSENVDLYIILNNMLDPEFEIVEANTLAIAGRAYLTLIKTYARSAVNATYILTQRAGIDFNLAYLDEVVPYEIGDPFNTKYMRRLFAIGYEKALSAHAWKKSPPAESGSNKPVFPRLRISTNSAVASDRNQSRIPMFSVDWKTP